MANSAENASMGIDSNSCTCSSTSLINEKRCLSDTSSVLDPPFRVNSNSTSRSNNLTVARLRTHNLLRKLHINSLRKQQQQEATENAIVTLCENEIEGENSSLLLLSELFCIVCKWLGSTSVGTILVGFVKVFTKSRLVGKVGVYLHSVEDLRKRIWLLVISTVVVVMKQLQKKKKKWISAVQQQSQILLRYSGLLENGNAREYEYNYEYSYDADADYDSEFEAEYDNDFSSENDTESTTDSDSVSEEDPSDVGSVFESDYDEENELETTSEDSADDNGTTDNDNADDDALSLIYAEKAALALMNLKTFKIIKENRSTILCLDNTIQAQMCLSEHGECKASIENLENVEELLFSSRIRSESERFELRCTICLQQWQAGQYARRLNCGHIYHPNCIYKWASFGKLTCPICRATI